MSSNMAISAGGVKYAKIDAQKYASSSGDVYMTSMTIDPNCYYEFNENERLYLTLKNTPAEKYEEYMFEFIPSSENFMFKLTVNRAVTWVEEPVFETGYRYQMSILNGIGRWVRVPVA